MVDKQYEYILEDLRTQLVEHEGCVLMPYEDSVGLMTIGIGRNIEERGISEDEAYYLLNNDIKLVEKELGKARPIVYTLNAARQRVLIDMTFNLGISRLMKFRKMWDAIMELDWVEASLQMMDSKWAKQVGRRATRLSKVMKTGKWE